MRSKPRRRAQRLTMAAAFAGAVALIGTVSGLATTLAPGPQPDGTAVTPHGWGITPAGRQTNVAPGPQAVAVSPDGRMVVVANAAYLDQSLEVIDPATGAITQTLPAPGGKATGSTWTYSAGHAHGFYVGLTFSPDGSTLYASDGPGSAVIRYQVSGGTLTAVGSVGLASKSGAGLWPAGIAVAPDGGRLFVAGNLADTLFVADPVTKKVLGMVPVGHLPYGVALDRSGNTAFISNWGADSVSVVDIASAKVVDTVRVGLHPESIVTSPTRDEIYVANADSDTVSVLSATTHAVLRTIDMRPYAGALIGASPVALAVSPDGSRLYVANAGDNDVALVGLAAPGSSGGDHVLGLIPTAWWPSGIALDPTGQTIFVTNMKGLGVGPALDRRNNGNPTTPTGGLRPNYAYWITQMHGTLSTIGVPGASQLAADTAQVAANDRFDAGSPSRSGSVIPSFPGGPTPIKHVIYVMKENRTYDQILGDLGQGNGDPSLAIFGQKVTPNTHALASRFVTLDNFYSDGDVSVDGWSWSNGADANDYLERNWPLDYGYYGRPEDFGGFGNNETAGQPGEHPGRSYLWDELNRAGVGYENFGFFMDNPPDPQSSMPGLTGHTDMQYPGWDLTVPDQVRIAQWLQVFDGYVARGSMPTMQFVYLPSDHTWATTTKARRPTAYVADNDLALGRLVDAVSHSQFWPTTAIFVVEDDTQDGPDHVNGHRMPALVISPYTQTGGVDSTFYSTASALRTMELILGVGPMTQFDAVATPMTTAFTSNPDFLPFDALPPQVSLWATNQATAPMADWSTRADFSHPDLMSPQLENEAIWKSVRGTSSGMPSPPDA
jgi:YVTN family beta-propeller protein